MRSRQQALWLLHLTVLIWGFTGIFGKLIQQGTLHLVYTRTVIAVAGLALMAWWMGRSLHWRTPKLGIYLLTGLIITGHWITFYGAIKISTASIAAACLSTSTVFTALLEPFWFKRRIRAYEVVLGVVVIAALLLMFGLETQYRLGIALGVFSALLSAWFNIVNGVLVKRGDAVRIGFYELLFVMLCALAWVLVHIPDKGQVTTRYYGWYANRPRGMRGTAAPAAADGPPAIVPAPRLAPSEATRRWAALLQQIFEVDPLACPTCQGAMRIVAFITQTEVIDRILTHLRTRAAHTAQPGARSPPSTRARRSRVASRASRPPADAPTLP